MPKSKRSPEEEEALLLDDEGDFEEFVCHAQPLYKTAVTKGVANHVGKWPSHLLAAFFIASLVMATFIAFAIVVTLCCTPIASHTCRKLKNIDVKESPNIYFVKHANRTWTSREMCHVESAIRENPKIKVYLINLLVEPQVDDNFVTTDAKKIDKTNNRQMIDMLNENSNNPPKSAIDSSKKIPMETMIRRKLGARYSNMRNVDVTIGDFFKGSMVSRICHKLDIETVEIAAKAYVLWNIPGVALEPNDARYLQRLGSYLCMKQREILTEAAVNPRGSVQASGVTCQAFIGCLIQQIAIRGSSRNWKIVEECRQSFCRSKMKECPGLKILNEATPLDDKAAFCPTIQPSSIGPKRFSPQIP